MRGRDSVEDNAKLFASGHLVRLTRNPEGLSQTLSHYFQVPVRMHEYIRSWIEIPLQHRTRLA